MDEDKKDYLIELDRIVERQIKVYGDLLDRISNEVRNEGLEDLADRIIYTKVNYGLGNYKPIEYKVKPFINVELARKLIVRFLETYKTKKFTAHQVTLNIDGKVSGKCWWNAIRHLLDSKVIKAEGRGRGRKYWIE